MFVGHAKQVSLVVDLMAAVWLRPDQAIEVLPAFTDDQAAGDDGVDFDRQRAEPAHALAVHAFRVAE